MRRRVLEAQKLPSNLFLQVPLLRPEEIELIPDKAGAEVEVYHLALLRIDVQLPKGLIYSLLHLPHLYAAQSIAQFPHQNAVLFFAGPIVHNEDPCPFLVCNDLGVSFKEYFLPVVLVEGESVAP